MIECQAKNIWKKKGTLAQSKSMCHLQMQGRIDSALKCWFACDGGDPSPPPPPHLAAPYILPLPARDASNSPFATRIFYFAYFCVCSS
jgi:hypothetical protein